MPGSNGRPLACKARAAVAVYCGLSLRRPGSDGPHVFAARCCGLPPPGCSQTIFPFHAGEVQTSAPSNHPDVPKAARQTIVANAQEGIDIVLVETGGRGSAGWAHAGPGCRGSAPGGADGLSTVRTSRESEEQLRCAERALVSMRETVGATPVSRIVRSVRRVARARECAHFRRAAGRRQQRDEFTA